MIDVTIVHSLFYRVDNRLIISGITAGFVLLSQNDCPLFSIGSHLNACTNASEEGIARYALSKVPRPDAVLFLRTSTATKIVTATRASAT